MYDQEKEKGQGQGHDKEPFVSQGDRPQVSPHLDTPVTELHVRDLIAILGWKASKAPEAQPPGTLKWLKDEKYEKLEKNEKGEMDIVVKGSDLFRPGPIERGDITQLVSQLADLQKQVSVLTDQIKQIQKGSGG
jgi:hypothetical protein